MLRRIAFVLVSFLLGASMVNGLTVSASAAPSIEVTEVTQRAAKSGSFSCAGQSWSTSWQGQFANGNFRWQIGFNRNNQRMAKLTVLAGGAANLYIEDYRETGVYRPDLVIGSESNGYTHCHAVRSTSNTVRFVARRSGSVWRDGLSFPPMS